MNTSRRKAVFVSLTADSILAAVVFVLGIFLWRQAGLPSLRLPYQLWIGLFALSFPAFSLFSFIFVRDATYRRKLIRINSAASWSSLLLIMMIMSWRIWSLWSVALASFYFIYIFLRSWIALQQLRDCSSTFERKGFYALLVMTSIMTAPLMMENPITPFNLLAMIGATVLNLLIAGIVWEIAARLEFRHYNMVTKWPSRISILLLLTCPFANYFSEPGFLQLLVVVVLGFVLISDRSEPIFMRWGYLISGLAMLMTAFAGAEFIGVAIWIYGLTIQRVLNTRSRNWFLEATGSTLFLIVSIAGMALIQRDGYIVGTYVWPVRTWVVLLGGFIDRETGMLFYNPWTMIACLGMLSYFGVRKKRFLMWLGPVIVFIPMSLISVIRTGQSINSDNSIVLIALMWPFSIFFLKSAFRPISNGLVRLFGIVSLLFGLVWLVNLSVKQAFNPSFTHLLSLFGSTSDINPYQFFPMLNQLSFGWSIALSIWTCVALAIVLIIYIESRSISSPPAPWAHEVVFLVLTALILISISLGIHHVRVWHFLDCGRIVLDSENPTVTIPFPADKEAAGIRIDSSLSNSPHITQGFPVANIKVISKENDVERLPIRAGVETAETAFDRKDVLNVIKHDRPQIAGSRQAYLDNGLPYPIHDYYAEWSLGKPQKIAQITLERNQALESTTTRINIERIGFRGVHNQRSLGIPFSIPMRNVWILGPEHPDMDLVLDSTARFSEIIVVSQLANAAEVSDGTVVGQVIIDTWDGRQISMIVRVGFETAEWSYDRPDLSGRIRHAKPVIAFSKRQKYSDGRTFLSHAFMGRTAFSEPFEPRRIHVRYVLPVDAGPNCQWTISAITFR